MILPIIMKNFNLKFTLLIFTLQFFSCDSIGDISPSKPNVIIVTEQWKADHIVFVVEQSYKADKVISSKAWESTADWILVDQLYKADLKIFITSKSYLSDFKVYFR